MAPPSQAAVDRVAQAWRDCVVAALVAMTMVHALAVQVIASEAKQSRDCFVAALLNDWARLHHGERSDAIAILGDRRPRSDFTG
jgi:hypothetical protein